MNQELDTIKTIGVFGGDARIFSGKMFGAKEPDTYDVDHQMVKRYVPFFDHLILAKESGYEGPPPEDLVENGILVRDYNSEFGISEPEISEGIVPGASHLLLEELDWEEAKALQSHSNRAHVLARMLRQKGFNAATTFDSPERGTIACKTSSLVRLTMSDFPYPDIPFHSIVQLRDDPDMVRRRHAFRLWLRKMAQSNVKPVEIMEELQELLYQYEEYMKIKKVKYNTGCAQLVFTTLAEVAENLVRFKFSNVVRTLFELDKQDIALAEAELTAPGREISFIAKLKENCLERNIDNR